MTNIFNKILGKLTPRGSFVAALRSKLLREFSELPWWVVPFAPRKAFAKSLRQQLLSQFASQSPARRSTLVVRFRSRWQQTRTASRVAVAALLSLALLIAPLPLLRQVAPTTSAAAAGTVLIAASGTVELGQQPAAVPTVLTAPTVIDTGSDGSATVQFFEDSLVRIAAQTRLQITGLRHSLLRDDLGEVALQLDAGQIWLRSLSTETSFSTLTIAIPQGELRVRAGGLAIAADDYGTTIAVAEHSALLSTQAGEFVLLPQQVMRVGRLGHLQSPPLSPEMQAWQQQNLRRDRVVLRQFTAEKLKKLQAGFVGSTALHELEQQFWQLAETALVTRLTTVDVADFAAQLRKLNTTNTTGVDAFLASASKTLAPALPDQPLYSLKTQLETLQAELSRDRELFAARQRSQRLWEAQQLAAAGKQQLAVRAVEQSQQITAGESPSGSNAVADLLQAEAEQLAVLEAVADDVGAKVAEDAAEQSLDRSLQIVNTARLEVETRRAQARMVRATATAIALYHDENGRKNALAARLRELPNTAENLALMERMHNRLPNEFAPQINQKIIQILSTQRAQAQRRGQHAAARVDR